MTALNQLANLEGEGWWARGLEENAISVFEKSRNRGESPRDLRRRVQRLVGAAIPPASFFDHRTTREWAVADVVASPFVGDTTVLDPPEIRHLLPGEDEGARNTVLVANEVRRGAAYFSSLVQKANATVLSFSLAIGLGGVPRVIELLRAAWPTRHDDVSGKRITTKDRAKLLSVPEKAFQLFRIALGFFGVRKVDARNTP